MKKIILAVTLLSLAFSFTTAQKNESVGPRKSTIKQVEVTAKTIAARPASKAYALDLTRKGTIYNLAADVDYSRVRVRTAKGEITMADLLKKSGKSISGKLRVGMTSDIRTQKLGLTRARGGTLNFSCGDTACVCTGDDDCNDLFTTDLCGPIAVCYPDGCVCLRI